MDNNIRTYSRDSIRKFAGVSSTPPRANKQIQHWKLSYEKVQLDSSSEDSDIDEIIPKPVRKRLASAAAAAATHTTPKKVNTTNGSSTPSSPNKIIILPSMPCPPDTPKRDFGRTKETETKPTTTATQTNSATKTTTTAVSTRPAVQPEIDRKSRLSIRSGQMLNDTIVDFYMNYLMQTTTASNRQSFHLFNTFFFSKLKELRKSVISKGGDTEMSCYEHTIRRWDRHVKIFDKDYLVVPVCDHHHWVLVIITHASRLPPAREAKFQSDKMPASLKSPLREPAIFIFDSLGYKYMPRFTLVIRIFLSYRWKFERPEAEPRDFRNENLMKDVAVRVPRQRNSYDCGVHMLHTFERFLESPAYLTRKILACEDLENYFGVDTRAKRHQIRSLLPEFPDSEEQSSGDNEVVLQS